MRVFVISCCILLTAAAPLPASAAVIHLKNGDAIYADEVVEDGASVRYQIGDNSFTIPKSRVATIEAGAPEAQSSPVMVAPPVFNEEPQPRSDRDLLEQVVRNQEVDRGVLNTIEGHHNAESTAIAYYLAAKSEYESGRFTESKRDFETALRFQPENPAILAYHAALLVRTGSPLDALSYAQRATRIAPNSADAFGILGYAEFSAGRNRDAIESWHKSLALRPDARIQGMLERAERESAAEKTYSERETGHFVLHFEGAHSSETFRDQLLSTLEAHYLDLSRTFGREPRSGIQVVLYTTQAFFDVTRAPTWISALNDGKIRIPMQGMQSVTPELSRVLRHELTHSFIRELTAGRCPSWLNEGIAQVLEARALGSRTARMAQLFKAEREIPLNTLERSFSSLSGEEAVLAYDESLLAASYLTAHYGMGDVVRVLERIGRGDSAESALRSVLHTDYGRLEEELRADLLRASAAN